MFGDAAQALTLVVWASRASFKVEACQDLLAARSISQFRRLESVRETQRSPWVQGKHLESEKEKGKEWTRGGGVLVRASAYNWGL